MAEAAPRVASDADKSLQPLTDISSVRGFSNTLTASTPIAPKNTTKDAISDRMTPTFGSELKPPRAIMSAIKALRAMATDMANKAKIATTTRLAGFAPGRLLSVIVGI